MEEIWESVNGFEGRYEVSNLGNFRSLDRAMIYSDGRVGRLKGRPIKGALDRTTGYMVATLDSTHKRYIHRLVAEAFLREPLARQTVNHKNGDKLDNRLENLEWASFRDNNNHARRTGLNCQHGENCNLSKFSDETIDAARAVYAKYRPTYRELADMFGMSLRTAWQVVNNQSRRRPSQ